MGTLIGWFMLKGLGERGARVAAYASIIAAILAAVVIGKVIYDGSVIAHHEAKREAKIAPAKEKAADQRAQDAVANTKKEEELHHAIDAAPKGGQLSPAAHALACQRLRNIGRVPPACRPERGDGGQAASH